MSEFDTLGTPDLNPAEHVSSGVDFSNLGLSNDTLSVLNAVSGTVYDANNEVGHLGTEIPPERPGIDPYFGE